MKRAGEIWSDMTDKEKKPYEKLHDQDVQRYEKQMKEMNDNGFFVLEDGSKSSEHTAKTKQRRKKKVESESEEESEEEEEVKPRKMKKSAK